MNAQFNESFSQFTHQFAAAASRANRLALESAETVFGVQLKTFEKNIDAFLRLPQRKREVVGELVKLLSSEA